VDIALVACHEAGHAVISQLLEPGSVDLVSVCRHKGEVGGITSQYQARNYFQSKKLMENRVLCLLAGKAATELCYGVTDTGTTEDMQRAFDIVLRFVDDYCSYGFDKFVFRERSSNDLLSRREQQVASELDRYYAQVKQMLAENRRFLDALTARLIAEKTLLAEQIAEVQQMA
jgi:cell division protease FtsH